MLSYLEFMASGPEFEVISCIADRLTGDLYRHAVLHGYQIHMYTHKGTSFAYNPNYAA